MATRPDDQGQPDEAAATLPPPRAGSSPVYRIAVVCLGNICRSPIGEVVLSDRLERAGLADSVEVVSAGTGEWHVGDPMDRRAAAVLSASGYDPSAHRAQQFNSSWFEAFDLVLAMDEGNRATIRALGDSDRLLMFRDFDPQATSDDRDVPDPYFGGDDGFDTVLEMVERTSDRVVDLLRQRFEEG